MNEDTDSCVKKKEANAISGILKKENILKFLKSKNFLHHSIKRFCKFVAKSHQAILGPPC